MKFETISLLLLLSFHVTYAGITSISFGLEQECGGGRTCKSMAALLTLSESQMDFKTTITEYKDNTGKTIVLNNTITIEASLKNATISFPFKYQKTLYNSYEEYEPGEGCAFGQVAKCSDPLTKPLKTSNGAEDFVLCCINTQGSYSSLTSQYRRRSGAHCMRTDYSAQYDQYIFSMSGVPETKNAVDVTISRGSGQTQTFQLSTLVSSIIKPNFGNVDMQVNRQNNRFGADEQMMALTYLVRDARKLQEVSSLEERLRWYIVDQSSNRNLKLGMDAAQYQAEATCLQPEQYVTKTHNVAEHSRDQFYEIRQRSLVGYLQEHEITYPGEIQVKVSGTQGIIDGNRKPDLVLLNILLNEV